MHKILSLLILFTFSFALEASDAKLEETKLLLQALMPFQKTAKAQGFSVEKCNIDKSKWMLLLITKQPFTESIKFDKDCDIEGSYTTKMGVPFPVHFKLRNLTNFSEVKFNFLIQLQYEPTPEIQIFMQNGTLTGKTDVITFDADYAAEIDPMARDFIKKDKGGHITIQTINKKKVNQKIPIKK
jgi:hypothetical protein